MTHRPLNEGPAPRRITTADERELRLECLHLAVAACATEACGVEEGEDIVFVAEAFFEYVTGQFSPPTGDKQMTPAGIRGATDDR